MKISSCFRLYSSLTLVLLAGAGLRAADSTAARSAPVTLAPGMPATEVQKALGKPTEVMPIKDSEGKGERWTYRVHIPATPARDGQPARTEHYQVLSLLMINGELVVAHQTIEGKTAPAK